MWGAVLGTKHHTSLDDELDELDADGSDGRSDAMGSASTKKM